MAENAADGERNSRFLGCRSRVFSPRALLGLKPRRPSSDPLPQMDEKGNPSPSPVLRRARRCRGLDSHR
eukprot:10601678-Lingulodinium_polyedra.AAC.1